MRLLIIMSILALLTGGCFQDLFDAGAGLSPITDVGSISGSNSTSTGESTPTTSWGPGVQTVTGPPDETSATTAAEPETTTGAPDQNAPPTIELFGFSPLYLSEEHVSEAGPALLHVAVSDDAVKVRLKLNGEPLGELGLEAFPYPHAVLSDKFNGQHIFEAVALDVEGLESAPKTAKLTVTVPASGTQKCLFDADKDNPAVLQSAATGLVYADDALVVVGERDTGVGPRLTVWKLDPDHCEVMPGWPKTIADWTKIDALKNKMSRGTAVALDFDGNIVVAGFTLDGLKPRRYLAMLNPGGSLLWNEVEGNAGEEISGVVVSPKPKAAVIAVGWRRSSDDPIRTDAAIWMYQLNGTALPPDFIGGSFMPNEQPDVDNKLSERLRAIVFPSGKEHAIAVGEREFMDNNFNIFSRTFLVRIHPLTGREGTPWTSPGESFAHDATLGLGVCGDELIGAGWRRDDPQGSEPAAMLQWFATDGTPTGFRSVPLSFTELRGAACDGELKAVAAGVKNQGVSDAKVFATPGLEGPLTWYESGSAGPDEAAAVSCDRRGFCGWPGFRTTAGKRHAVVRVYHP